MAYDWSGVLFCICLISWAVFIGLLPTVILNLIKICNGRESVGIGELNNTHLILNTYKEASNTLYKKVCLSLNYEYSHFKEMLSIVQLLKNRGCDYTLKATESDYFVAFTVIDSNGCEMNCSRLKYVNDANANGSSINVISLNNFWGILNVTEQDLLDMPFPEPSMFKCKKKSNSNPIRYNDSFSTTLGDVLRNQGIDLKKAY